MLYIDSMCCMLDMLALRRDILGFECVGDSNAPARLRDHPAMTSTGSSASNMNECGSAPHCYATRSQTAAIVFAASDYHDDVI